MIAIDTGEGILLKLKNPFQETILGDVAGCLNYLEEPKSLEEIETAIRQGVMEQYDRL